LCSCNSGNGPPVEVPLDVPTFVGILPGGSAEMRVRIVGDVDSSLAIGASDLPPSLTLDPVRLPAHGTSGDVTFHAAAGAPRGVVSVHLVGTGDTASAQAVLNLSVGTAAGVPDETFGQHGLATVDIKHPGAITALAIGSVGTVVVAGYSSPENYFADDPVAKDHPFSLIVGRLKGDGTLDQTYASGGTGELAGAYRVLGASLDPTSRLRVAGADDGFHAALWRVGTSGALDTTFGTAGRVTIDGSVRIDAVDVDANGIRAVGDSSNGFVTVHLTDAGARGRVSRHPRTGPDALRAGPLEPDRLHRHQSSPSSSSSPSSPSSQS
jgi:hypothetical protein